MIICRSRKRRDRKRKPCVGLVHRSYVLLGRVSYSIWMSSNPGELCALRLWAFGKFGRRSTQIGCGSRLSRSQTDLRVFLQELHFSSLSKADSQLITYSSKLYSCIKHRPYNGCQQRLSYAFGLILSRLRYLPNFASSPTTFTSKFFFIWVCSGYA